MPTTQGPSNRPKARILVLAFFNPLDAAPVPSQCAVRRQALSKNEQFDRTCLEEVALKAVRTVLPNASVRAPDALTTAKKSIVQ